MGPHEVAALNRRCFLARFGGVIPAAASLPGSRLEQANEMAGAPMCPRCNRVVQVVPPIWDIRPNEPAAVECACGWTGTQIRVRTPR